MRDTMISGVAILAFSAAVANASGPTEPVMDPNEVAAQTTSSAATLIVPIIAVVLAVAAVASSSGGGPESAADALAN